MEPSRRSARLVARHESLALEEETKEAEEAEDGATHPSYFSRPLSRPGSPHLDDAHDDDQADVAVGVRAAAFVRGPVSGATVRG